MNINLNVNVKTYEELIYLVSTAADEVDSQFTGFDVKVLVYSQDKLEAIIIRNKGEEAKSSLLY